VAARGQQFVGPDNGLFTFVFEEPGWSAVALEAAQARLPEVSRSFHGRDVFAPAAASLSLGTPLGRLGPPLADPVRLPWPGACWRGGALVGTVVHVDRFGNLITSIRAADLEAFGRQESLAVEVEGREVGRVVGCYADVESKRAAALLGSSDRLEIFVREGSAQAETGATRKAQVVVRKC
ncbi:MAG: S-adenosyl-l-methionine hydroxide adenosyltransferase family protein, partial [Candidatus Methylomirabilia bacterium]